MRTLPTLLAVMLASGALHAFATDHDHAPAPAVASATPSAGTEAGGCRKMMAGKAGHAATGAAGAPGRPDMHTHMAQHHAVMKGPGLQPALSPDAAAALELDAGQRERLAALEKQNRVLQWALLGELREERMSLDALLEPPEPDPSAATARLRAVQDLEARLFEARLAARRDALALLTPEQRGRLAAHKRHKGEPGRAGRHDHAAASDKQAPEDDVDEKGDDDDDDAHATHR